METVNRMGKYTFTKEEKEDFASKLAEQCSEKNSIEDEKKEVNSDYKARIDRCNSEINVLSRKITTGYEMRDFKCRVVKNYKKGIKEFVSVETNEVIAWEKFSTEDYQMHVNDVDIEEIEAEEYVPNKPTLLLPEDTESLGDEAEED